MELAYAILARFTDLSGDGTLAALGLDFDSVRTPQLPAVAPLSFIAKIESADFGELSPPGTVQFDVVGPDGKSILDAPIVDMQIPLQKPMHPLLVPSRKRSMRIVFGLNGVVLQSAGEYEVRFEVAAHADSGTVVLKKVLTFMVEIVNV